MKLMLKERPLYLLKETPIMMDANTFMVGIERRGTDPRYSFESIKELYLEPVLESFSDIYIHEEVYRELDQEAKDFLASYIGKNVRLVGEDELYGKDPRYTTIFNNIAGHELFNYDRRDSKNRGEVFSMAYAAFHNINYFCSKDTIVDLVCEDLEDLRNVEIVTLDIVLLAACVYYRDRNDTSHNKALKAIYKTYCDDVIRRHTLPKTLGEYIEVAKEYL